MRAALPSLAPRMDEAQADARLAKDASDVEALIAKADHAWNRDEAKSAHSWYTAAVNRAAARQAGLSAGLRRDVVRAQGQLETLAALFREHLLASLSSAGHGPHSWHPRFRLSLSMMLGDVARPGEHRHYPQSPRVYFYPGMDHLEFAEPGDFVWSKAVAAQVDAIRSEALALLGAHAEAGFRPYVQGSDDRPQADYHGMLGNPDWSSFFLIENGSDIAEHIARCPQAFAVLDQHAPLCRIAGRSPSVLFSLLRPGAHIPPHSGMLNARLICHLPLIVPDACRFRVGHSSREWREGELMIFDDSIEHEAWNNSPSDRLVLLFDIWRPELEPIERDQISALFAAVDSYGR